MDAKIAFLSNALASSSHIDGLYVGYPSGAFVQGVDIAANPSWRQAISAPAESSYAIRTIEIAAGGKRSVWRYFQSDGRPLGERVADTVSYDPRRRPWYKVASRLGAPTTVGPYTMATTGKLGLTVATAMEEDPVVVVGSDVLLETIGHLLPGRRFHPTRSPTYSVRQSGSSSIRTRR